MTHRNASEGKQSVRPLMTPAIKKAGKPQPDRPVWRVWAGATWGKRGFLSRLSVPFPGLFPRIPLWFAALSSLVHGENSSGFPGRSAHNSSAIGSGSSNLNLFSHRPFTRAS